jgi:hypothetical protein
MLSSFRAFNAYKQAEKVSKTPLNLAPVLADPLGSLSAADN